MINRLIILITICSFLFSERGDLISSELLSSKNKDETLGIQLTSITQDVRMRFNIPRNVNGVLIL